MKPWYEKLFANFASKYDEVSIVQGTKGECDFLEQEIHYNKDCRILDIGCGTGRHSLEMARRGYKVKGIDLSEAMLNRARKVASEENLDIEFIRQDARKINIENESDLVIMMCEGAFPLMETDEMNYQILQNACRALRPGGKLIFTTLNGLFPLFHSVKDFMEKNAAEGQFTNQVNTFDLMTFREQNITSIVDDDGNTVEAECNERFYVPSEINWLLKSLNMTGISIFGAHLGEFSRQHALKTDDYEMLVVAEKK